MNELDMLCMVLDVFGGSIHRNSGVWEWRNNRYGRDEVQGNSLPELLKGILRRVHGQGAKPDE